MQAPEPTPTSQPKEEDEDEDDLPELPWKMVTSAVALPDGTDLDDKNHVQTADKAVAASPAVMKPKSYAAVAKASVVTAAAPQPAAVPKLSVAASVTSTDLKPATASKLAADTTLLKVNICMHTSLKVHVQGACACTFWEAVRGSGGVTDQGRTYLTTQPIRSPSCPNPILTTFSPRSSPHSAGAAKHRGNR